MAMGQPQSRSRRRLVRSATPTRQKCTFMTYLRASTVGCTRAMRGWWQDMDLWGEDVIIHRRALRSYYRVNDPSKADYFFGACMGFKRDVADELGLS